MGLALIFTVDGGSPGKQLPARARAQRGDTNLCWAHPWVFHVNSNGACPLPARVPRLRRWVRCFIAYPALPRWA